MKALSDKAEGLLPDLQKRVGVDQESSEKLETQLKVLLIQQCRDDVAKELVARTARTLAACLQNRGDRLQAEQYAMMAINLERPPERIAHGAGWRVHSKIDRREVDPALWREKAPVAATGPHSLGRSLGNLLNVFKR